MNECNFARARRERGHCAWKGAKQNTHTKQKLTNTVEDCWHYHWNCSVKLKVVTVVVKIVVKVVVVIAEVAGPVPEAEAAMAAMSSHQTYNMHLSKNTRSHNDHQSSPCHQPNPKPTFPPSPASTTPLKKERKNEKRKEKNNPT